VISLPRLDRARRYHRRGRRHVGWHHSARQHRLS